MAGDARQEGFCWIEEHFNGFEGVDGVGRRIENAKEEREKEGI